MSLRTRALMHVYCSPISRTSVDRSEGRHPYTIMMITRVSTIRFRQSGNFMQSSNFQKLSEPSWATSVLPQQQRTTNEAISIDLKDKPHTTVGTRREDSNSLRDRYCNGNNACSWSYRGWTLYTCFMLDCNFLSAKHRSGVHRVMRLT